MTDFEVIHEGLLSMQACTTLTDEELSTYRGVSGTSNGWTRWTENLPEGVEAAVPCQDHEGRRHVLFEC